MRPPTCRGAAQPDATFHVKHAAGPNATTARSAQASTTTKCPLRGPGPQAPGVSSKRKTAGELCVPRLGLSRAPSSAGEPGRRYWKPHAAEKAVRNRSRREGVRFSMRKVLIRRCDWMSDCFPRDMGVCQNDKSAAQVSLLVATGARTAMFHVKRCVGRGDSGPGRRRRAVGLDVGDVDGHSDRLEGEREPCRGNTRYGTSGVGTEDQMCMSKESRLCRM